MLSQAEVLRYVKDNLAFPYQHIEWDDDKILEFIDDNTRKEFSYYHPRINHIVPLNTDLAANKVPGTQNKFYITEPCGLEIYNVVEMYTTGGASLYLYGHPPLGPMSHGEIQDWALATEMSMTTKQFGSFDYTFEFVHPNIIRISPIASSSIGTVLLELETEQPSDLSHIRNDMHMYFKRLALADVMIALGRVRRRYSGQLRTPFGEIPLESEILEEGKEMRREVIEVLERLYVPNVEFEHG